MDPLLFSLTWVLGWGMLLVVVWHLRAARRESVPGGTVKSYLSGARERLRRQAMAERVRLD